MKKTSDVRDEIQVAVEIGRGSMDVSPVERQAMLALGFAIGECGLGALTPANVRTFTSTRRASLAFGSLPGAFELRGTTDRASLGFQLEWLLAQCTEPRFEADAVTRAVQTWLLRQTGSSSGDLSMRFCSKLVGEPIHPDLELLAAIDARDVMQLVRTKWIGAAITVVVVGDLDVDQVVASVGRTFGRLAKRDDLEASSSREARLIAGGVHEQHDLRTPEPAGSVFVFAPVPLQRRDGDRALMRVLTTVLTDRLDARIREAMGATYSVAVDRMWFAAKSHCEAVRVQARVQPGRENDVLDVIRRECADLRENGPTADELAAAVRFLGREDRDRRTKNGFWLVALGSSHGDPSLLAALASADADLAAVTRDAVHEAARAIFVADGMSSLVLHAKRTK